MRASHASFLGQSTSDCDKSCSGTDKTARGHHPGVGDPYCSTLVFVWGGIEIGNLFFLNHNHHTSVLKLLENIPMVCARKLAKV
jgi:hypothetical protein